MHKIFLHTTTCSKSNLKQKNYILAHFLWHAWIVQSVCVIYYRQQWKGLFSIYTEDSGSWNSSIGFLSELLVFSEWKSESLVKRMNRSCRSFLKSDGSGRSFLKSHGSDRAKSDWSDWLLGIKRGKNCGQSFKKYKKRFFRANCSFF